MRDCVMLTRFTLRSVIKMNGQCDSVFCNLRLLRELKIRGTVYSFFCVSYSAAVTVFPSRVLNDVNFFLPRRFFFNFN